MHRVIGKEMYEQLGAELGIEQSELYKTESNYKIAIRNYTYRRYESINTLLRAGESSRKHQIAVELLVQALESLPVHDESYLVRWTNLTPEHLGLLSSEGNIVRELSFTSTSRDPGFFLSGYRHRLLIKHYNGRYIAPWSCYDDIEDEVLIPPEAVFKTHGYSDEHGSYLLTQLSDEEIRALGEQGSISGEDVGGDE